VSPGSRFAYEVRIMLVHVPLFRFAAIGLIVFAFVHPASAQ
jgi:hypothetical protein